MTKLTLYLKTKQKCTRSIFCFFSSAGEKVTNIGDNKVTKSIGIQDSVDSSMKSSVTFMFELHDQFANTCTMVFPYWWTFRLLLMIVTDNFQEIYM